jgi:hypothetical protein
MSGYPDLLNDTLVDAKYTVIYNLTAYGTEKKSIIPSEIAQVVMDT